MVGPQDAAPNWDRWDGYAVTMHDRSLCVVTPALTERSPGEAGLELREGEGESGEFVQAVQFRSWAHEPDKQEIEEALAESGLPPLVPGPPTNLFDEDGSERPDVMARFTALGEQWRKTGWWPNAGDAERCFSRPSEMTTPPTVEVRLLPSDPVLPRPRTPNTRVTRGSG